MFEGALVATIYSRLRLSPALYDKYKRIADFHINMHNLKIRARTYPAWYSLPYMVTEAEMDQVIATWPPAWKIGLKSIIPVTTSTSGRDTIPKGTAPQTTTKDTKMHSNRKETTKDTNKETAQEPEQDIETGGVNGEGADSP